MLDDYTQRDGEPVRRAHDLDASLGLVTRHRPPEPTALRLSADHAVALGGGEARQLRDGIRRDRDLALNGVAHARRVVERRASALRVGLGARRLLDGAGAEAARADVRALRVPSMRTRTRWTIRVEAPLRGHHRVAPAVAERRLLPADCTDLRHERLGSVPTSRRLSSARARRDLPSRAPCGPPRRRGRCAPPPARASRS